MFAFRHRFPLTLRSLPKEPTFPFQGFGLFAKGFIGTTYWQQMKG